MLRKTPAEALNSVEIMIIWNTQVYEHVLLGFGSIATVFHSKRSSSDGLGLGLNKIHMKNT